MNFFPRHPATASIVLCTAAALACAGTASASSANGNGGAAFGDFPGEAGTAGLHAKPHALLGRSLRFAGTTTPGATVAIQRLEDGAWVTAATATADEAGEYVARWRTDHIGVFEIRAVPSRGAEVRAAQADDAITVTVFRQARATWYGPGFFGRRTACGKRMSKTLVGVAHLSLPCGTRVAFLYKGRTITVPVVDRGPFSGGASWDLTYAAAKMLGFAFTDSLGAVSLKRG
jgi:hypothetical protein